MSQVVAALALATTTVSGRHYLYLRVITTVYLFMIRRGHT